MASRRFSSKSASVRQHPGGVSLRIKPCGFVTLSYLAGFAFVINALWQSVRLGRPRSSSRAVAPEQGSERVTGFYEKVIKVKADLAAVLV
jgi:hypothetical protein